MQAVSQTSQPVTSLTELKGVGEALQSKLKQIGITSISDLLFYFPIRYLDKTRISPISTLRHGEQVQIQGTIQKANVQFGKRRSLLLQICDESGYISVRFFYFNRHQQAQLIPGKTIKCFGEVRKIRLHLEMIHPQYQLLKSDVMVEVDDHLTAIYASSEGIQQKLWEK